MMQSVAVLTVFSMIVGAVPSNAEAAVLPDPAPACTVAVVSNDNGAVPTVGGVQTFIHPAWTTSIAGGQWLWSDAQVINTTVDVTKNFSQNFVWGGETITDIDFQFAADNGYVVKLNGDTIASKAPSLSDDNHSAVTQITVNPDDILIGENTLSFEISNIGVAESNFESNPAGFVFKLIIDGTGTTCNEIPPVDVCKNIEGNQASLPKGYVLDGNQCYQTDPEVPGEECEIEGHKYNVAGRPLFGWTIGLEKVATAGENTEIYDILESVTDENGYYCLEWGEDPEFKLRGEDTIEGPYTSFMYRVYEILKSGWSNNNVEKGVDTESLAVANDVQTDGAYVSVQVGETNGFIYANQAYHVDFYNKENSNNDNTGEDTYKLFGYVWHDVDEDDNRDEEPVLSEWTVRAVNASNSEEVYIDKTDVAGRYEFNVPVGTWIISELTESGWVLLSAADGDGTYTVTVPEAEGFTLINMLIPTAFAASLGEYGPYNFGNDFVGDSSNRGGGSGSRRRSTAPTGEVLGSSTSVPAGLVLGDATSTLPVGAPNTGAGGTGAAAVSLPVMNAILSNSTNLKKSK